MISEKSENSLSAAASGAKHEPVLVVDDENIVRGLLCEFLRRMDYPSLSASSAKEALEVFRNEKPQIVVTDFYMPGMDGIELLRRIRREDPDAKVVLMTGLGDEAVALEALRAGASNYIKKPIKLEEFLFIIQAHERLIRAKRRQRLPASCVVGEHRIFSLMNDQNLIYAAAYNLMSGMNEFMSRQDADGLLLALTEALTNAFEHGSLGIGYEQKSHALQENAYHKLLEQKLADPALNGKRITLEYRMNPEQIWIRVADEGKGFDWRNRPDPTDPENMMREHGRGLSIMSLFTDEMSFNDAGNEVCMVKRLDPRRFEMREG